MGTMRLGLIGLALLLIIIIANSVYIVTDKQTAILLRFGEIVNPKIESGLHFKVPILHTVRKFDSRVLTLDAIPQPYFTAEKKRLIVDAFVKWRITDNEQFYITSSGGQLRYNITYKRLKLIGVRQSKCTVRSVDERIIKI